MAMKEMAGVIPVMDIMGGLVVQARGARRASYKPVSSPLLTSPDPFHFIETFIIGGHGVFYIADLDAITGNGDNRKIVAKLAEVYPVEIYLDEGYTTAPVTPPHPDIVPVVATETFTTWENPGDLSKAAVSIDMRGDSLVTPVAGLTINNVLSFARAAGCERFIHLHMDAIGEGGFDPNVLIPPLGNEFWIAGGGLRSKDDLRTLISVGYQAALVSTALHRGAI